MDARAFKGNHPSMRLIRTPLAARGFTLVEFLVVISIVMLLTAILMPSLARSRDARRVGEREVTGDERPLGRDMLQLMIRPTLRCRTGAAAWPQDQ